MFKLMLAFDYNLSAMFVSNKLHHHCSMLLFSLQLLYLTLFLACHLIILHPPFTSLLLPPQLFELLGPEGLEMISALLQQRVAIVDSFLTIPSDRQRYPPRKTDLWQQDHISCNAKSTLL